MMNEEQVKQNGSGYEFAGMLGAAYRLSAEVGREVEALLKSNRERPLSQEEGRTLIRRAVHAIREGAIQRDDRETIAALSGDLDRLVERILRENGDVASTNVDQNGIIKTLSLEDHNGIAVRQVFPRPMFQGIEVPMDSGFVRTRDIKLWDENERLEIHLAQFQHEHGRKPSHEEILAILLGQTVLPGVMAKDEFQIQDLARSIAVNGVRKPPIIDVDGTLLDGNRRLAACLLVLNSPEFTSDERRRVERIFVWQLTKYATPNEREAVVVSLNFESECKKDWPDYVRARKVTDAWQAMLNLELRPPGSQRQRELKRKLARQFAYGNDVNKVNRFLKMMQWSDDFEDYLINERELDKYQVQHGASEHFQYFDELSKGDTAGGVAHTLNQDTTFKHLVFDLLYDDKFKNWNLVRNLRYNDADVRASLENARDQKCNTKGDLEDVQDDISAALTAARMRQRDQRVLGADTRIKVFVDWLVQLPMDAFHKEVKTPTLEALLGALKNVDAVVKTRREFEAERAAARANSEVLLFPEEI